MNKQINILRGLQFCYYATNAVVLPLLPLYFSAKGYSSLQIGILMMIGPFMALFFQPLWGYISDKLNTVKKIVGLLWLLGVLSSVGLFTTDGYALSFVFALLLYFFLIPSVPLLDSITIQSVQQTKATYGSVRLFGSIGFTIVAIGLGYLVPALGGVESIMYLYWLLWIVPFVLLFFLQDSPPSKERISLQSLKQIAGNKMLLWFLLIVFLIGVPHRMNDALLGLYMQDLGASETMIMWAWAIAAIVEVPTFYWLSRHVHRYHELSLLGVVSVLYTIRWIICAVTDSPVVLMYMQATHMITWAVFWIVAVYYAVKLVPEYLRSTGQSVLSAVFLGLCGLTGGSIGGVLNGQWGGGSMFAFGAVMTAAAAVLLFASQYYLNKKNRAVTAE